LGLSEEGVERSHLFQDVFLVRVVEGSQSDELIEGLSDVLRWQMVVHLYNLTISHDLASTRRTLRNCSSS
jgi:hypothetical protein